MEHKGDVRPFLLKLGVAFALSFAGFFYSQLRTRRIRPRSPGDSDIDFASTKNEILPGAGACALIHAENDEVAGNQNVITDNPVVGFSLANKDSGDEEGLILPKFNNLVLKEFEMTGTDTKLVSARKEVEPPMPLTKAADKKMEEEITRLRNMVQALQERERTLESQLLEYYGLKAQETTVKELQNRLKINAMETKLLNLHIESLKADKQRLEAQVADYLKVVSELESARATIKLLKQKITFEEEQTKEQLSSLQQRLANLQDQEHRTAGDDLDDQKFQNNLKRLKELETESIELRRDNSRLLNENSELMKRLELTQNLASSVSDLQEAQALQEANHRLRQENGDLTKEIERLQANRCADVEELVYLRWINACLRYELRNYQAAPGKTVAKELSKTLSPRSEEKVKQLILEYANTEGRGDRGSLMDFDYEYWSSSQDSNVTESGEFDDSSIDISSASRTHSSSKSKFFSKLRRLVRGKDSHKTDRASSADKTTVYATSRRGESVSADSFEEMLGTYSCDTLSSQHNSTILVSDLTRIEARMDERRKTIDFSRPPQNLSRGSSDIQRPRHLSLEDISDGIGIWRNSDAGSLHYHRTTILKEDSVDDLLQDNNLDPPEKSELTKLAMVLKGSHGSSSSHKRSMSYSSY